jgi:putative SOS response-associated peptidase YedK
MAPIHPRMPAIPVPRDYERWLAPADPMRLPIDLLRPFDSEQLKAWKVSTDVGNVHNDRPDLIDVQPESKALAESLSLFPNRGIQP